MTESKQEKSSGKRHDCHQTELEKREYKSVLAAVLYVNHHTGTEIKESGGSLKDVSPLEETCRAIANAMRQRFGVPCAVSVAKPKQSARTYACNPEEDTTWANLADVIHKHGENFTHYTIPLTSNARNAQLYMCRQITPEHFSETLFLNEISPHLTQALDNAYKAELDQDEKRGLTRMMAKGVIAKDYELGDISILPPFFSKASGIMLLDQVLKRAASDKKPVTIILSDIDYFKKVNDTYGHIHGDAALQIVGRSIYYNVDHTDPHDKAIYDIFEVKHPDNEARKKHAKICRQWKDEVVANLLSPMHDPKDFLIKFGGEEFITVLYDADLNHRLNIARRLQDAVALADVPITDETDNPGMQYGEFPELGDILRRYASTAFFEDRTIYRLPANKISLSMGLATNLDHETGLIVPIGAMELIKQADAALYEAKKRRNSIVLFDPSTMMEREEK